MMARRSTRLQGNIDLLDYMERPAQPEEVAPACVLCGGSGFQLHHW